MQAGSVVKCVQVVGSKLVHLPGDLQRLLVFRALVRLAELSLKRAEIRFLIICTGLADQAAEKRGDQQRRQDKRSSVGCVESRHWFLLVGMGHFAGPARGRLGSSG